MTEVDDGNNPEETNGSDEKSSRSEASPEQEGPKKKAICLLEGHSTAKAKP